MSLCVIQRESVYDRLFYLQAQLEVKQLSTECHRLKEEGERRAAELERELRSREQLHSREKDSFTAKAREQEAYAQGKLPPSQVCHVWSYCTFSTLISTDRGA